MAAGALAAAGAAGSRRSRCCCVRLYAVVTPVWLAPGEGSADGSERRAGARAVTVETVAVGSGLVLLLASPCFRMSGWVTSTSTSPMTCLPRCSWTRPPPATRPYGALTSTTPPPVTVDAGDDQRLTILFSGCDAGPGEREPAPTRT